MSDGKNFLNELLKIHYQNADSSILLHHEKQTFFPRKVLRFAPVPIRGYWRRYYSITGQYWHHNWVQQKRVNWYKVSIYSQVH